MATQIGDGACPRPSSLVGAAELGGEPGHLPPGGSGAVWSRLPSRPSEDALAGHMLLNTGRTPEPCSLGWGGLGSGSLPPLIKTNKQTNNDNQKKTQTDSKFTDN